MVPEFTYMRYASESTFCFYLQVWKVSRLCHVGDLP